VEKCNKPSKVFPFEKVVGFQTQQGVIMSIFRQAERSVMGFLVWLDEDENVIVRFCCEIVWLA
jgi:hypothetical protein